MDILSSRSDSVIFVFIFCNCTAVDLPSLRKNWLSGIKKEKNDSAVSVSLFLLWLLLLVFTQKFALDFTLALLNFLGGFCLCLNHQISKYLFAIHANI